jgi:hypothetical protein
MTVFSMTLRYFRNHAIMELSDATGSQVRCDDVRWVVTVPAIWRQKAKQFMREAAYQVSRKVLSVFISSEECERSERL